MALATFPPWNYQTMDPVQMKKMSSLLSSSWRLRCPPGPFPSRLDPCPACDVFCLDGMRTLLEMVQMLVDPSTVRAWVCPTVSSVLPQVLPVCHLAAWVLTVSDLRMACLLSHWKMVWQLRQLSFTSERWVKLLSHFSMTSMWSWLFEVRRISCAVWSVTQRKARTGLKWSCPYTMCLPLPVI